MTTRRKLDEAARAALYYTADLLLDSVEECAGHYGMSTFSLIEYWQTVTIHIVLSSLDGRVRAAMDHEQKIAHLVAMLPHHEAGVRALYARYLQQLEEDPAVFDGPRKRGREMLAERASRTASVKNPERLH